MHTDLVTGDQLLEIACDESGAEGENHIGANTDVFAHASVKMSVDAAADCIQQIRAEIRSPAQEYKANHLLRQKHRAVLSWLLGPSGPLTEAGHVYLIDKKYFVVTTVVGQLLANGTQNAPRVLGQDRHAAEVAVTLYREGLRKVGDAYWQAFLEAANDLMRTKNRQGAALPVDSFFHMVERMRLAGAGEPLDGILDLLAKTQPRAEQLRAQLLADATRFPVLDPLIPAVIQTVAYWSERGQPVSIVHDEQAAFTAERVAQIQEMFENMHQTFPRRSPPGRLASLRLVDSRSDARVQVADFLAGVARKIAEDELNSRGNSELTALLRPYVDSSSLWADPRSWSLLAPEPNDRS